MTGPTWVKNRRDRLLEGDTTGPDSRWRIAVEPWWALELSARFASPVSSYLVQTSGSIDRAIQPKGFATTSRPEEIQIWIKYVRATKPKIKNVDKFISNWTQWWHKLNPEWRKADGALIQSEEGSVETMRKPGANSFLSVLIGLKWWRDDKGETSEWLAAFDDITSVMRRLLKWYALSLKPVIEA
ncbi:hypothetical protein C8R45DRAFT_843741 [Mycena sanguinolenta]|nr:hypothetical protein C8R45DRAFT_843741 [Mycena sanguinolenta]